MDKDCEKVLRHIMESRISLHRASGHFSEASAWQSAYDIIKYAINGDYDNLCEFDYLDIIIEE